MKKLLIISDSHGNEAGILEVLKQHSDVDAVIHLGDFERDTNCIKNKTVYSVRGNCDIGSTQKSKRLITINGKRILMIHGNKQRVKSTLLNLSFYAQEKGADIALFGHSHIPTEQYSGSVLLYNPGALSGMIPTYGIMRIKENGSVKFKTYKLLP